MQRFLIFASCLLCLAALCPAAAPPVEHGDMIDVAATDWPWWRGPTRDGVAKQTPPLTWSATQNVLWQAPVPGRGHGSPIVVGDRVFLATADEQNQKQSLVCYSATTGKQLWQTTVHEGNFVKGGNARSSHASSTPACDGKRVFINFPNNAGIYTTAVSLDGKQLWQTKVSDYVLHQGYGSSPAVYRSLVIVSADNKGGGAVAGLDRASGKVVWKQERPKLPNYASPIILNVAGRDQLLMTGCDKVSGFDPLTGKQRWETKGSTTECVTSTVTDGERIFTSGGYPRNHVSAVLADGSGKVVWENGSRVYVPSMLVRKGHLYAVLDAGIATCWKSDDGKEVWKGRLTDKGAFSSSLVLAGEHLFATNEAGVTYVFLALPDGLKVVAKNQLGQEAMASPAVCGGRIYLRAVTRDKDRRQDVLYCVGEK